ncbi:hypothetical protein SNEBB_001624 [Seison nebaliae]|nr:hypothetical protein SNEBB_001624 [Seison nebaliae]
MNKNYFQLFYRTTCHSFIVLGNEDSKPKFPRIIWMFFILFVLALSFFFLTRLTSDYAKNAEVVSYTVKMFKKIAFPRVTLCSNKPSNGKQILKIALAKWYKFHKKLFRFNDLKSLFITNGISPIIVKMEKFYHSLLEEVCADEEPKNRLLCRPFLNTNSDYENVLQFFHNCSNEIFHSSFKLARLLSDSRYQIIGYKNMGIFRLLHRMTMNITYASEKFDDILLKELLIKSSKKTICMANTSRFLISQLIRSNVISVIMLIYQQAYIALQNDGRLESNCCRNFHNIQPNFNNVSSTEEIMERVNHEIKRHKEAFWHNVKMNPILNLNQFKLSFKYTMNIIKIYFDKDDLKFKYDHFNIEKIIILPKELVYYGTNYVDQYFDEGFCSTLPWTTDHPFYYLGSKKPTLNFEINLNRPRTKLKFFKLYLHTSESLYGIPEVGININGGVLTTLKIQITELKRIDNQERHYVYQFSQTKAKRDCLKQKLNDYLIQNYNLSYFKNTQSEEAVFDRASSYIAFMNIPIENITNWFKRDCEQQKKEKSNQYIFKINKSISSFDRDTIKYRKFTTRLYLKKYLRNYSANEINDIISSGSYKDNHTIMTYLRKTSGTYENAQNMAYIKLTYDGSEVRFKEFEKIYNIPKFISNWGGVTGLTNGMSFFKVYFHASSNLKGLPDSGINIIAGVRNILKIQITEVERNSRKIVNNIYKFVNSRTGRDCFNDKFNKYLLNKYNFSYFKTSGNIQEESAFDRVSSYLKFINIPNEIKNNFKKQCLSNKRRDKQYIIKAHHSTRSLDKNTIQRLKAKSTVLIRKLCGKRNVPPNEIEELIRNGSYKNDKQIMHILEYSFGTYEHMKLDIYRTCGL